MLKGLIINDKMNEYEKEHKKASYKTIVERYINDIVLCNNIVEVDESIYNNFINAYDEESDEIVDIYQYFLCNVDEDTIKLLSHYGFIFSYSDLLECDVLCVDHLGTSWSYVLTSCPLFDTWEELEEYNKEGGK